MKGSKGKTNITIGKIGGKIGQKIGVEGFLIFEIEQVCDFAARSMPGHINGVTVRIKYTNGSSFFPRMLFQLIEMTFGAIGAEKHH